MGETPPDPLGGDHSAGPWQRTVAVGEGSPAHPDDTLGGGREQDQNYNAVSRSNGSKLYSWDEAIVSFFPVNQEEEKEKEEEEVQKDGAEEEDEEKEEVEEEEEITTTMSLPQQCSRVALVVKVIVSFQ